MPDPIQKIALSRHAERALAARPELARELAASGPFSDAEMSHALTGASVDSEPALKCRLRRLRERVLLRVMHRDLEGKASLEEVCGTFSLLAEMEIRAALEWIGARDLIVVAMGKLGGGELNVS